MLFAGCYTSITDVPQKISVAEKVPQQKKRWPGGQERPGRTSLTKLSPHLCAFISSGLDHHRGLLASLPDSIHCAPEFSL